jgi:putative flippase GtrA
MVGSLGAIVNYSIFFILLNKFQVFYIAASGMGFILSVFLAFYLNKKYTFQITGKTKSSLIKYFSVNLFSLLIGLIFLAYLVENLLINVYLSNLLVIGVQTISNFLGSKFIAFR